MKASGFLVSGFIVIMLVLGVTVVSHAELYDRGTDALGNRLIYDSDLNITWYDYTNPDRSWELEVSWADSLDIDYGGTHFSDWRLPITFNQSCSGDNCTNSELGHLYYTSLSNPAGGPLENTGLFTHLYPVNYWSGTEDTTSVYDEAWFFDFNLGSQDFDYKTNWRHAIAVRPGDVAVIPEPISFVLFLTGGATLLGRRFLKRNLA